MDELFTHGWFAQSYTPWYPRWQSGFPAEIVSLTIFSYTAAEDLAMATWQLQHAKARLSDLIQQAETDGPQFITRHGTERAVVLSAKEYRDIKGPRKSFIEHLLSGPKVDGFETERDRTPYSGFEFESDE